MADYRSPFEILELGGTQFIHRGSCEFDITGLPEGSFMQWTVHTMIEGSSIGLGRKQPCKWTAEKGAVVCTIATAGVGRIVWRFAQGDAGLLSFVLTVHNDSSSDFADVSVSVHNFPSPRLFRGERTYVEAGGQIREIRELWTPGQNASQGLYPARGFDLCGCYKGSNWVVVPCRITAPFVYRIGGGNEPTPHARWCEDRPVVAGMACEALEAVLSNFAWPCLDLHMYYGTIAAGACASQRGLIGIMEGTAEDFVRAARAITPQGTAG